MMSELAGYEVEISINPDFVRSDKIKGLYGLLPLLEATLGNHRKFVLTDILARMLAEKEGA